MKKSIVMLLISIMLITTFTIILPIKNCEAEPYEARVMIHPTDDTNIKHGISSNNFGSSNKIIIRNEYGYAGSSGWGWDALIKFDTSNIPEDTNIISAKLKIYYYDHNYYNYTNHNLNIYRITNDWDENIVTWDNQPTYESQKTTTSNISDFPSSWIEFDVTDNVQNYINKDLNNYGWKISDETDWEHFSIPEFFFKTKDSNNSEYWPYLEILFDNEKPIVNFSYNISAYQRKVDFIDNSSDIDGSIISWHWDFGDKTNSTQQNPSHTYNKCGYYNVNLTVTDNFDGSNYSQITIYIPIEERVKIEIEKQYNLTLNELFYINDDYDFIDPNKKIFCIRTINSSNIYSYLLSINNSLDEIFYWNSSIDNISKVKYENGEITGYINDSENEYYIVNVSVNSSNWTYFKINDPYEQIQISMIKRSDGSIVPEEYIWREDQNIYILDKLDSEYQIIFSNATDENKNIQETTTEENKLIWVFILCLTIFCILIICFIKFISMRRKNVSKFIDKGNEKIKEVDLFISNHNKNF